MRATVGEREREREMNWWLHISLVVVECARCFSGSYVGEGVVTTWPPTGAMLGTRSADLARSRTKLESPCGPRGFSRSIPCRLLAQPREYEVMHAQRWWCHRPRRRLRHFGGHCSFFSFSLFISFRLLFIFFSSRSLHRELYVVIASSIPEIFFATWIQSMIEFNRREEEWFLGWKKEKKKRKKTLVRFSFALW